MVSVAPPSARTAPLRKDNIFHPRWGGQTAKRALITRPVHKSATKVLCFLYATDYLKVEALFLEEPPACTPEPQPRSSNALHLPTQVRARHSTSTNAPATDGMSLSLSKQRDLARSSSV
jgi:hypothetical protein